MVLAETHQEEGFLGGRAHLGVPVLAGVFGTPLGRSGGRGPGHGARRRSGALALGLCLLGGAAGLGPFSPDAPSAVAEEATEEEAAGPWLAPAFVLTSRAGEELALEDLRGRVVLLEFWASWCLPCRDHLSGLERMHRRPEYAEVVFLAINLDEGDRTRVEEILDTLELSFPLLWGSRKVRDRYWIRALPSTFLIDREGNLRFRRTGGGRDALEAVSQGLDELLRATHQSTSRP